MCIVSFNPHSHLQNKYNFYSDFMDGETYLGEVAKQK